MSQGLKTTVAALLITAQLGFFALYPTQVAYALDGGAGWVNVARELADVVGKMTARLLLVQFLNKIVDRVKFLGRDGGPAFVREWASFMAEGQYRGEDKFRTMLANTKTCAHLQGDVNTAYGVNPKFKATNLAGVLTRRDALDPFALRARCTLPAGFDIAAYSAKPSENGGWEAFLRLLEPQNNAVGLALLAADELEGHREAQEKSDISEAESGSGFTSARGSGGDTCAEGGDGGGARCVILKKIGTPGNLLGNTANASVDKLLDFIVNTNELTDSIVVNAAATAISTAIVARINDFASDESSNDSFTQVDTREQRANEYCTLISPRDEVDAEFSPIFDQTPGDIGPCPSPDKGNLGYTNICVQRCMQALGLIDDEITLDELSGPPQFPASPSPTP